MSRRRRTARAEPLRLYVALQRDFAAPRACLALAVRNALSRVRLVRAIAVGGS